MFVPPSPPSCSTMARNESLFLGQQLNLTCSSFGGKPPAKLTWIRGNNEVLDAEHLQLQDTISIYHTFLRPQDFGMVFTCIASSPALEASQNCTIGPLYPTSVVQIEIVSEIGDSQLKPLSLQCSANFTIFGISEFSPAMNYLWYFNGKLVESGIYGKYDMHFKFPSKTTRLPLNMEITCEAFERYGSLGNATVRIPSYKQATRFTESVHLNPKTSFTMQKTVFIVVGILILLATGILIVVFVVKIKKYLYLNNQQAIVYRLESSDS